MIVEAFIVMVAATMIQHMGLAQAVAKVITKILSCHVCFTFWSCLCWGFMNANEPVTVIALSILMAYLSNWFVMLLVLINDKSEEIWHRLKIK